MRTIAVFLTILFSLHASASDVFGLLWEPKVLFDKQLFPSYAWANATRNATEDSEKSKSESERIMKGDREGQLGFAFTNLSSKTYLIEVHVECSDIMEKSVYKTMADKSLVKFEIFPEIAYKFEALRANKEPRPISVKFTVYVDGKLEGSKSQNIILRSKNDCPYTFITENNYKVDLNYMYATYVNENNPRITNEILPAIFKQGAISSVSGYQNGKLGVYQQVFAVWNYFNSLGIKYSSLNSPSQIMNKDARPFIMYQYVRTFDEALDSRQANCVDGTVAMASVLYKMGIQPIIVTTPNHCFLGFITDKEQGDVDFIETTAFGTSFTKEELDFVNEQVGSIDPQLECDFTQSFSKFKATLLLGRKNYLENEKMLNAYNPIKRLDLLLDNKEDEIVTQMQYRMFTVDSYRKTGLIPIN